MQKGRTATSVKLNYLLRPNTSWNGCGTHNFDNIW